jgi:hypothetical protein
LHRHIAADVDQLSHGRREPEPSCKDGHVTLIEQTMRRKLASERRAIRPFGTSVVLPTGLPVSGEILTSHVRSIDTLARPISYAGAAVPAAIFDDVRSKLAALIGL